MATRTLGEVATIIMGQSPPGYTTSTEPHGMPLLNGPTEFGPHHPTPVQYTTEPRKQARKGDILFCVRGSTTGRMNWADRDYAIGRGIAAIRHSTDIRLQPFVRAVLEYHLADLLAQATGSTFPNVSREQLRSLPYPPLTTREQLAIASIFRALDEKIELTHRMNQTLEAIARALFKSWFVDFEPVRARMDGRWPQGLAPAIAALFPNRFERSELGPIPQGWRVGCLDDLVSILNIRVPADPSKDEERYVALDDMPSKSIDLGRYRSGKEVNSSIIRFSKGDILFGNMRPYFHKVGLAQFDGITRTTTFVLRPRSPYLRSFALMHLSNDEVIRYATDVSVGTTIPYVRWDALSRYAIAIPDRELLELYAKITAPMLDRIAANSSCTMTLSQLRDTLLPKLVSGQIRIKDAEKIIGEIV